MLTGKNMNHSVLICVPPPAVWGVWKPWIINSDPLFLHIPSMALILSISSPITSRRNVWQQQQRIQIFCVLSLSTESHRRRLRIPTNPESKKSCETAWNGTGNSKTKPSCVSQRVLSLLVNTWAFPRIDFTPDHDAITCYQWIFQTGVFWSLSQYFVARVATCLKRLPGIRFIISIIMCKNQLRRWG